MRSRMLLLLLLSACHASDPGTDAPAPGPAPGGARATITGPIGDAGVRGHALWDSWYAMADVGYTEDEYFVSGSSTSAAGAQAEYVTRIIVWRPIEAARFNGTLVLDWVNVTAQFENAVDTLESHAFLQREGYAFVHVSAQAAGICCTPLTPQVWDPERYADLSHPGDDWSFDMLTQIADALRHPGAVDPMGGLAVQRVLAAGQSQSASRLYSYVNLGFADARAIDGILIHGGGSKTFERSVPVPVLHLLSDNEADPAEPTADANYALWEMAGSSHTDFFVGYHQVAGQGPRATADQPQQPASADVDLHATADNYGEQPSQFFATCILAGSAYPMRYAVNAALAALDRWIRTGQRAPQGPRFAFDGTGALVPDEHGNTTGGIRYPVVEAPVARYASTACPLGGVTIPFTDAELALLYPTHTDYYCRFAAATAKAVADGFMLPADADELLARARAAASRWTDAGPGTCSG